MKTETNHNRTLRLKPHYVFGTVALATLLALLAAMHPRGNQFVAESLVTIEPSATPAGELSERDGRLQSSFASAETVAAALETLPTAVVKDAGFDGLTTDSLIKLVRGRLSVEIERAAESTIETVHVRYASKSQPFAIRLVSAICDHIVENYAEDETSPAFLYGLSTADQGIQALKDELVRLRSVQEQLLQNSVAALRQADQQQREINTSAPSVSHQDQELQPPSLTLPDEDPSSVVSTKSPDDFETNTGDVFGGEISSDDDGETATAQPIQTDEFAEAAPSNGADLDTDEEDVPFPDVFAGAPSGRNGKETSSLTDPDENFPTDDFVNNDSAAEPAKPLVGRPLAEDSHAPLLDEPKPRTAAPTAQPPAAKSPGEHSQPTSPLPEVYELNPRWSAVSNALSRARLELDQALEKMTPKHPIVADLNDQIKDLERILSRTPQYLRSEAGQPNPTLTPLPVFESDRSQSSVSPARDDSIRRVSFSEAAARQTVATSDEFLALGEKIRDVKAQLASAINQHNMLAASPPQANAAVAREAILVDSHCPIVTPFDLLTLFIPAGVLALVAAIARTPAQPPAVLHSVSDAKKTLRSEIVGSISTKNGPGIPTAELGGPPAIVRWLVFASEIVCVAAAVLVLISVFQIPGYTKQFFTNPFSAFVTSFDFVVQFIRHT